MKRVRQALLRLGFQPTNDESVNMALYRPSKVLFVEDTGHPMGRYRLRIHEAAPNGLGRLMSCKEYPATGLIAEATKELPEFDDAADEATLNAALIVDPIETFLKSKGYEPQCEKGWANKLWRKLWTSTRGDIFYVSTFDLTELGTIQHTSSGYSTHEEQLPRTLSAVKSVVKTLFARLGSSGIVESEELPDFDDAADEASLDLALHLEDIEKALYWNRFEKEPMYGDNVWIRYEPDLRGVEYTFKVYYNKRTGNMRVSLLANNATRYEATVHATHQNLITALRAAMFETGLGLPIHESAELPDFDDAADDATFDRSVSKDGPIPGVLETLGFRSIKHFGIDLPNYRLDTPKLVIKAQLDSTNATNWIITHFPPEDVRLAVRKEKREHEVLGYLKQVFRRYGITT